jgi:F-type H+-transporting ATPase subunit b
VAWQNRVDMPRYRVVEVSLTGDRTPEQWNQDAAFRNAHLERLAGRRYQPVQEKALRLADGTVFPPDRPLTRANFEALARDRVAHGGDTNVELRDPAALYAFASQRYRLRNPLPALGAPGGEAVDKAFLDRLIDADVPFIHIVGYANPISLQPGTIVLVTLIFLALVAALQGLYWEPILRIVEERKRETDEGAALAKSNQAALARLEDDRARRLLEARRSRLERILDARAKAKAEADMITHDARDRERALKRNAMAEIRSASQTAREQLRADIPRLAREIARQVLGRDAK